jgi:ATP-dependent DNA helicase RecG
MRAIALASGIPTIAGALTAHGLPPAHYTDANIRFTVLLHRPAPPSRTPTLSPTELRVFEALASGTHTVTDLHTGLGLTAPNIRKALRSLRNHGLVHQDGGKGRPTTYRQTVPRH